MTTSIRSLLHPELAIAQMPPRRWRGKIRAILFFNRSPIIVAFKYVLKARNCTRLGLGYGQCVKSPKACNSVPSIIRMMEKRNASMSGCSMYVETLKPQSITQCVESGIKNIYYARGSPNREVVRILRALGVSIDRVRT